MLERIASEFPANVVRNETGRLVTFLRQEGKQELGDAVEAWTADRF
ncbi:MAG: hypothetical protein AAGI52_16835 [Bacteroidota bacterium]